LGSCRHLIVLPDGCLRKLPFSLLVSAREKRRVEPDRLFAQYRGCRFLIEELSISYLPTAGLLISPAPGPRVDSEKASVVMMADPDPMPHGAKPLPGARTETEMALRCFRVDRARLFTGAEASEANLKGITSSPALLHLACHASLNDRRPAYSRLALAPGQGEDGWLHAFEIERLTMNARLVVLSACETMGSQGRGEGLLGLCRAFLQSGASSVLATAWMVDDQATAMLMGRFYLALASGKTPANALQSAQQYVIRKGSRPGMNLIHPFFWAGFMHTGVDE
ncbi:MAG: CHAT domain-containing protein, partial [Planctomycetota bacterium]